MSIITMQQNEINKTLFTFIYFLIWMTPYSLRPGLIGSGLQAANTAASVTLSILELFVRHKAVQPMLFAPVKINHFGHYNTNWSRGLPIP